MAQEFIATESGSLEECAAAEMEFLTIGQVRRAIDEGLIALNGRRAARNAPVEPGDVVSVGDEIFSSCSVLTPVPNELPILFDDAALIAVDKRRGLAVVPERDGRWPFMGMLLYHARECSICGGAGRFRVVHRLDRDTTGVVVLAKTLDAGRRLSESFAGRLVDKRYLAIVAAEPSLDEGLIDEPLGPSGRGRPLMKVARGGRPCITQWRMLERFRGFALVQACPRTGRTHQIRVHLANAGMPLAVDGMYAGRTALCLSQFKRNYKPRGDERPLIDRLTLHCSRLSFPHPATGATIAVEAPLPDDFERALAALRKFAAPGSR